MKSSYSIFAILFFVSLLPADPILALQTDGDRGKKTDQPAAGEPRPELTPAQQEKLIARQTKRVTQIEKLMTEAGDLFKKESYAKSATKTKLAKKRLIELAAEADPPMLEMLSGAYNRIAKAQELLGSQGEEFEALVPLAEMGSLLPVIAESKVSFTDDIAPIFVQHCGRCHVRGAKGKFSMASFTDLLDGAPKGEVLVPGDPDKSTLFTLVENGKMPPKSKGIPKKELKLLKDWIAEGGHYDGENQDDKLMDYVKVRGNGSGNGRGGRDR